ncbi:MAG: ComF family protein [Planctomycetes bacterium]|nr:ComF family protein [Planctomycetota bacterium]
MLAGLVSLVAPIACLGCRDPLPEATPGWPGALCLPCRRSLTWIDVACAGCGRARGPGLLSCARCSACVGQARGRVQETIALWRYRGPGRALVRRLKYEGMASLGPPLGAALADRVQTAIPSLDASTLVVAIPLHSVRRLQRGYNQAQEVARGLSSALDLELGEPLLRRRWTAPLYGVPRRERAQAVRGAFGLRRAPGVEGRPILLVDDVRTSGATLRAAARVLHQGGAATIRAAVLAR